MELRAKQIREMSKEEVEERLKSLKESLLRERASVAMGGQPASPGKIRSLKRQIARILSVSSTEDKK